MLAELLLDAGKADEAARVVADASSNAGESRELAELAGEIYMARGRYTEAFAAFGPRALLTSRGRRLRWRSWWRSGGPLRPRSGRGRVLTGDARTGTAARAPGLAQAGVGEMTGEG